MAYLVLKALLSGVIIMMVSEIARRSPSIGALVVSLPLVSLLAILWLWRDTGDVVRIAEHAEATFWYVLPSLPMFLALPYMLRHGVGFWWALGATCVLTIGLYFLTSCSLRASACGSEPSLIDLLAARVRRPRRLRVPAGG